MLLELLHEQRTVLGYELHAAYVHHGLSPNADAWARFCAATCEALQIPFQCLRVDVAHKTTVGIEAAARQARYQALFSVAADYIVLAQHQNDQAETLLLQLLRGAGVKGLSAMARYDAARRLLRPLIDTPRDALLQFAAARDLQWIEDESNQDLRYDRNYIRHQVLPLIESRFKGAHKVLARIADHMAEGADLLDELAALDAGYQGLTAAQLKQTLPVACLQRLNSARARNLLRWWLAHNRLAMPTAARLREMLQQLLSARADAAIHVKIDAATVLRRYRDMVYVERRRPLVPINLLWSGESELVLADGSCLCFTRDIGRGLAVERLDVQRLRVTGRVGGERFKPSPGRPTRTLKHLLQEAGMPPWQRQRLPLLYWQDELAIVPGIGVATHLQAQDGEAGLVVEWRESAP